MSNVMIIKSIIIKSFESVFLLKVNFSKNRCGVIEVYQSQILIMTRFLYILSISFVYLGIHIGVNYKKKNAT